MCQIEAVLSIFDWIKTYSIMSCIFFDWSARRMKMIVIRHRNFARQIAYDVNFTFF